MAQSADSSWKRLYKAGGASLALAGVLLLAALVAFLTGPQTFGAGGESVLKSIASNRSGYVISEGLFGFSSILLVPGILALYVSVKDLEKSYALLGVVILLFSLTQLVLSTSAGSLLALSDKYVAATTDAQRATFSAASEAVNPMGVSAGPFMGGIGIIIISIVMLKGVFHKGVGYLGIATGLVLLSTVVGLGFLVPGLFIIFAVLLAVWSIAVGSKLYRLG